ncbi:MAG: 4Fe-4S dicluster domain-containing protein, partial [Fusobacteriaceae bacterium]
CGLCTTGCPVKIVKIDNHKINLKGYNPSTVVEVDKCIGCGNCAIMCPDYVITVERD